MGVKDVFKKIWMGVQVLAPFIQGAASLIPGGGPVLLVFQSLSQLITRAETLFPAQGSGVEKAAYFTRQGMKVAEILTGKNFDSPQGIALLDEYAKAEVDVRNAQAHFQIIATKVKDYIASVKEPAKADTDL